MTAPLRPMNLGEILDRTFQIYRSRFFAFVLIAAIPTLLMDLLLLVDENWLHARTLVQPGWTKSGLFFWNSVVSLGFFHISSILYLLVEPASFKMVSGKILDYECSSAAAIRFASVRWKSYLWIAILKTAAVLVVPELLAAMLLIAEAVFFIATGSRATGVVSVVIFFVPALMGIILFLWCGACFSLALPIAVFEDLKGFKSLRRSWALSRGTRTRVLFVWLVVFISLWILAWGLEFLLGQLMFLVGRTLHIAEIMHHLYRSAAFVLVTAIYALVGPIYPIAITLFYYDQRIRLEAYDIERMMDAAGLISPILTAPTAAQVTTPEETDLVTPTAAEETHS
ncbi:MAG: hypothetical protein ABSD67_06475 [Terracidiphilus sp.]|jgi:hypothetical protein